MKLQNLKKTFKRAAVTLLTFALLLAENSTALAYPRESAAESATAAATGRKPTPSVVTKKNGTGNIEIDITKQPESTAVKAGKSATFAVEAEGNDLSYLWEVNKNGTWEECKNNTHKSAVYSIQKVRSYMNGYSFRCKITGSGKEAYSDTAVLTVKPELQITGQPKNQTVRVNKQAEFFVEAEGDGLTYQWQYKTKTGQWKYCKNSTKNNPLYEVKAYVSLDGGSFRCIVRDSDGIEVKSEAATLTVETLIQDEYIINFVSNAPVGSVDGTMDPQKCLYEVTYSLHKNKFERDGYAFKCWTTDKDGNGDKYEDEGDVKNLAKSGSVWLYAQWVTTYTIKFNGNGGTGSTDSMKNCRSDKSCSLTANGYEKTGYRFTGWNTKKNGEGDAYSDGQKVKGLSDKAGGKVTLYAQWSANTYTVEFDSNGGVGNMDSMTELYGESFNLPANTFTKTGYHFIGWCKEEDKYTGFPTYRDKQKVWNLTGDETIKLYAQWSDNTYSLYLNDNDGGDSELLNNCCYYSKVYSLPKNPYYKKGYDFVGWNTQADGKGVSYTDEAEVQKLTAEDQGKVTLYAQWEKKGTFISGTITKVNQKRLSVELTNSGTERIIILGGSSYPCYYYPNCGDYYEGRLQNSDGSGLSSITMSENSTATFCIGFEYFILQNVSGHVTFDIIYKGEHRTVYLYADGTVKIY